MRLTIQTSRLTLRPPTDADAEGLARGMGDFDVARMAVSLPHPYPMEAAEGWVFLAAARRRRGVDYAFVIDLGDGGVAGCISVFRRRGEPDWEAGYWIGAARRGRGYATEALSALLDAAREDLGATHMTAHHVSDNSASRRVLEKAGFTPTGRERFDYCLARNDRVRGLEMTRALGAPQALTSQPGGGSSRAPTRSPPDTKQTMGRRTCA